MGSATFQVAPEGFQPDGPTQIKRSEITSNEA